MGLDYYASAPTVVLAHPPSHPFSDGLSRLSSRSPSLGSYRAKHPIPPSMNYLAAVSHAAAGRKRSIADVDDPEENHTVLTEDSTPKLKPKPEPVCGPGMTLTYPGDPSFSIAAESQMGTWREEQHDEERHAAPPVRRMSMPRKAQRVSSDYDMASSLAADGVVDDSGSTMGELIMSLGVGWKNVMSNPLLRDAARAYARVIENHFDFTDVVVMLQKESLSAYLVCAQLGHAHGYWLFSDCLQWCQLVGWSLQRAVQNLAAGPIPRVEGERIVARQRTPASCSPDVGPSTADVAMADVDAMQM